MGVSRLGAQKKEHWANVKVVTAGSSCHSWKRKRWGMAEPRSVEEPWRAEEEVLLAPLVLSRGTLSCWHSDLCRHIAGGLVRPGRA